MADYMSAWMEIGGPIRARQTRGLLAAIEADGAREEWGGGPVTKLPLTGIETLKLYNEDAPWGQFQAVETFCEEQGLAFDRHSEGKYEFDAQQILFRPGRATVFRYVIGSTGEPVVLWNDIVAATAKLRAGDAASALTLLEQALGPDVPTLTPLVLIKPKRTTKKRVR